MNVVGKIAIITGGARGIGLQIGKTLLGGGLEELCIIDIFEDKATIEELCKEYPRKKIIFQKCDVSKKEEIEKCFKVVFSQFKRFDILVNAAAIFNDINVEQTLMINVAGVINSSLCGMEYMSIEKGGMGGVIINIASITGLGPSYFAPVYTSSKWAVLGFTRSMAHDYYVKKTGVKFIAICPGCIMTNIFNQLTDKLIYKELKQIVDTDVLKNVTFQDIRITGNCVLQALSTSKNGSVLVCDSNTIKEIELTELSQDFMMKN